MCYVEAFECVRYFVVHMMDLRVCISAFFVFFFVYTAADTQCAV